MENNWEVLTSSQLKDLEKSEQMMETVKASQAVELNRAHAKAL